MAARSADQVDETARLVEEAGGRATACTVDVSDAGAVQQMITQVEHDAGPVDLLVLNKTRQSLPHLDRYGR